MDGHHSESECKLCTCRYSKVHFIDLEALRLRLSEPPMKPAEFEGLVKSQCAQARDTLEKQ